MFEFELDVIDPQLEFQEVVASLVSTAESVVAEHPELRNALTPDDGAYEEAIRVRAACQRVLRLFEDASEKLPEQEVIGVSEELKTLFLSSKSREAPGKLVFAARTLYSAYQNRANAADNLQWRVAQLQSDVATLKDAVAKLIADNARLSTQLAAVNVLNINRSEETGICTIGCDNGKDGGQLQLK